MLALPNSLAERRELLALLTSRDRRTRRNRLVNYQPYWPGASMYMATIEEGGSSKADIERVFQDWLGNYGEPFMVDEPTATCLVGYGVDPLFYAIP